MLTAGDRAGLTPAVAWSGPAVVDCVVTSPVRENAVKSLARRGEHSLKAGGKCAAFL